jgi:hypothetical protein
MACSKSCRPNGLRKWAMHPASIASMRAGAFREPNDQSTGVISAIME